MKTWPVHEKFLRTTRNLLLILKWHANFRFVLSVHSTLDSECLVQQKRELERPRDKQGGNLFSKHVQSFLLAMHWLV